ncbi:SET domain-containing protein 5 [Yamadazyma tenuis]|uniref:Histone-lysine N-methyltransferase SET5 n=1 Tax=Candida tenuis (strain ATCC 10573 / BCRC 21748 / CBS 615 / JCM 9827 / NBRC 10315 / NRRL Y-1498 / VKM Y-70) TaxID=590646 RepID=G3B5N9_CANTC|nr:uncharacterized protein CANTEDRAFT_105840 [Yamadazyma tenuis ATCC 10573]EGV63274.1 hypothetical protein CANTEDRAFT_105840 [Yamadazyma tenuis ATCC 10573]WEJ96910.1 SET domain-containing protein 5 [Yamadazyma tenuis]
MPDSLAKHIEVISINDSKEEDQEPVVPHERQVVDDVIAIWREDPSTESASISKLHGIVKQRHPNWSVSEKRIKTLLKKFGLSNNANQQFNYAGEISSASDPNLQLPEKVKVIMTTKRGKGLYAKSNIAKGTLIWEEKPFFFIPPLANLKLIKSGKACTYCGKLLTSARSSSGVSMLRGLDCTGCPELWCSMSCKKMNGTLHASLKHLSKGRKSALNPEAFLDLEEYCIKEQWNALFAITLMFADIVEDKSGEKLKYVKSMARVSQATRYKALESSAGSFDSLTGGALFVKEQQENLWKEGFSKFSKVFPKATSDGTVDYNEYLTLLGSYNINNLDSCVFRIQSHLNHTCNPNVDVETSPNSRYEGIKVFAAKDIKAGEELSTTYVNPNHTVLQRQRELRANWGFTCSCNKCKEDLKAQHRRQSSTASGGSEKKADIRKMLNETREELDGESIELEIPNDHSGERRKSVRFDEKVTVSS